MSATARTCSSTRRRRPRRSTTPARRRRPHSANIAAATSALSITPTTPAAAAPAPSSARKHAVTSCASSTDQMSSMSRDGVSTRPGRNGTLDVRDVVEPVSTRTVSSRPRCRDDVGVHPVADHHRCSPSAPHPIERAAEHHGVWLADEVGFPAGGLGDQGRDRAGGRQRPSADGPVTSGLVAMNRAPPRISRTALVIAANEYVRVSPRTTKSGSMSVRV